MTVPIKVIVWVYEPEETPVVSDVFTTYTSPYGSTSMIHAD